MANEHASDAEMQTAASSCDPEPACAAALIGSVCVAIALSVVIWTTYNAFDRNGFDVSEAVICPALAALGFQLAGSTQGARETVVMPAPLERTTSR